MFGEPLSPAEGRERDMNYRTVLYVGFSALLGILLGTLVTAHIVTGYCKSQNWFVSGSETYLCKQVKPF